MLVVKRCPVIGYIEGSHNHCKDELSCVVKITCDNSLSSLALNSLVLRFDLVPHATHIKLLDTWLFSWKVSFDTMVSPWAQ